ncbi:dehydrogenase [Paenibacillus sinopodophylli]|uniref:dehydrogenase n=1 Tax=Paenibacillus sinopodophylli TaxID=1837342 RepID=UPI00110CED8E|nr:dehydrogenase [Paenibacillus sinopodophylli]
MRANTPKHNAGYPTARKIRRACSNELYRTVKRMKLWIAKDKMDQAEAIYFKKVILNLKWIVENESNRKVQSDWWDDNVSAEIAALWEVDRAELCAAFRDAYGG